MESAAAQPEPQRPTAPAGAVDAPPVPGRIPWARPLALVGLLGWLVPGFGQLLLGRVRKAVVMGLSICGLYAGGLWLTGFVCVDPEKYGLEFVAHVLAGGPTLLTLQLTDGLLPQTFHPHFDVGRLYVAVASLLNVVAVSDALGDALTHNAAVRELRRRRRQQAEVEAQMRQALEDAHSLPTDGDPAGDGAQELMP
mgnify:CR=1 FL=1